MDEGSKVSKNISISNLIITITAVVAPASYLIGIYYHQGLLSGFGVDVDTFPIGTSDSYVNCYNAVSYFLIEVMSKLHQLYKFLFHPPNLYITILVIICFVLCIFGLIKIQRKLKNTKFEKLSVLASKAIQYLHWKNNDFTRSLSDLDINLLQI